MCGLIRRNENVSGKNITNIVNEKLQLQKAYIIPNHYKNLHFRIKFDS